MLSNNNFCIFSFNSISASVIDVSVKYIELTGANKSANKKRIKRIDNHF